MLTVVSGIVARELSIYDFNDPRGVTTFLLDYSRGPTGTALGGALQIVNTFVIPNSDYDAALSQQVGFFVYNGGIIFFPGFVTTLGNVTTNAGVTWASWRITKRCMSGRAGSSARFSRSATSPGWQAAPS